MNSGFGDTLKELRIAKNLTQQQLADRLFVNRSSVANWESGRRIPDLVLTARIARVLGVDISSLTNAAEGSSASPEIIVVDDEKILLAGIIPVISDVIPQATITGFSRPSEAVEYSKKNHVSIAFLDIELGKVSGLDLCRTLLDIDPTTNVVFLTSYQDYALKAWNTMACGFLVKPLTREDLEEQLKRLRYPLAGMMGE